MSNEFTFSITTTRFDEDYSPSEDSRTTTNFANLARGEHRQQNLRRTLAMINDRFNDLARRDNPGRDRYSVELVIVSAELQFSSDGADHRFPLIEVLDIQIVDRLTGARFPGIVGNNFSSYVRDFDFSVRLPAVNEGSSEFTVPGDFGDLHGKLFQHFLDSEAYRERFAVDPVICISVSTSRTYRRTGKHHPTLGVEYQQDDYSLTDEYFRKMGLQVRYFLPPGGVAPLAFYFRGDLLSDYTDLQLIGTISVMETFQRIYRPEIYNANSPAAEIYRPTLDQQDYSPTAIVYDRVERGQLAKKQGEYTEDHFVKPHGELLEQWAERFPVRVG
ncbi:DUF1852 domain-containing protein [Nesterenkonia salmonea]|uniref:DUF1852 domain-containing protein n=1 Tax=Nesterenkonia salmonea TaxID=1804987 RepID=A0A5R9B7A1_9MICC|nr:putative oxygenase MesX [Nesterenkonia salmonea]TLP92924.1 DUF1852 domain-containing protein [Nesterenkonia salmonea]